MIPAPMQMRASNDDLPRRDPTLTEEFKLSRDAEQMMTRAFLWGFALGVPLGLALGLMLLSYVGLVAVGPR